jgi:hypothetical protein
MMDREELRHHIDAVAPGDSLTATRLASMIIGTCWPGGVADRTDRAAREWLRQWDPDSGAADVPQCSCSTGRCVLCN